MNSKENQAIGGLTANIFTAIKQKKLNQDAEKGFR